MELDLIKTLSKYGEEITTIFRKLKALTILDEGQKLSIYDNVLCIDGTWYPSIQSFTRFILNQGRVHIYNYLKTNFLEYEKLINCINIYDGITRHDVELRRELISKSRVFFQDAKMGMVVLKMSYPDYKELHDLIDSFSENINKVHLGFSPKLTPDMSPKLTPDMSPKI